MILVVGNNQSRQKDLSLMHVGKSEKKSFNLILQEENDLSIPSWATLSIVSKFSMFPILSVFIDFTSKDFLLQLYKSVVISHE